MSTSKFKYKSKLYKEKVSFKDKYPNNTKGNSFSNIK
jgi:hypothetical protein